MNKRIYQAENIGHFFASSTANWATGTDPEDTVRRLRRADSKNNYLMKKKLDHKLYFVPLPEDADYHLVHFAPDVPGTLFLGTYKYVSPKQAKALE